MQLATSGSDLAERSWDKTARAQTRLQQAAAPSASWLRRRPATRTSHEGPNPAEDYALLPSCSSADRHAPPDVGRRRLVGT